MACKNAACFFCNLKQGHEGLGKSSAALSFSGLEACLWIIHKQQNLSYLYFPGVVHDDQTEQNDRGETDKAFQS